MLDANVIFVSKTKLALLLQVGKQFLKSLVPKTVCLTGVV